MDTSVPPGALVPYCERLVGGAEPWNVLSNLAFVLLGLYAAARWRRAAGPSTGDRAAAERPARPRRDAAADLALIALPFGIATGSALYHARPTPATQLADLVPIALFVLLALALALDRVLRLARPVRVGTLLAWLVATLGCARFPQVLNGSLLYLPTLALLAVLGPIARRSGGVSPSVVRRLAAVALAFAAALVARTLDLPLCPVPPIGTHPLWHLFAALAGGFAVHVLLPVTGPSSRSDHR